VAIGCLNYFFVEPIFSFNVARTQDGVMLLAFLGTALAITGLVRRVDVAESKRAIEEEVRRNEQRYRHLFQYSPVALLQIDTRALMKLFEDAFSRGITDYEAFLAENPDFRRQAVKAHIIVDANQSAVDMFGARDVSELLGSTERIWGPNPEAY